MAEIIIKHTREERMGTSTVLSGNTNVETFVKQDGETPEYFDNFAIQNQGSSTLEVHAKNTIVQVPAGASIAIPCTDCSEISIQGLDGGSIYTYYAYNGALYNPFKSAPKGGEGGGAETLDWNVSYVDNRVWRASSSSGMYYPSYWTTSGEDKGRITVPLINWGAILMQDFDVRKGDDITVTGAVWVDGAAITSSAYVGFFTEEEFGNVTKDDIRWVRLATVSNTTKKTETYDKVIASKDGKLCFLCVHGTESSSYTAFFHPLSVEVVRGKSAVDAYTKAETDRLFAKKTDVEADNILTTSASGNPVVMEGLQGGVPFNSVEVNSKNIYPVFYFAEKSTDKIQSTINSDGTVTFSAETGVTNTYPLSSNISSRVDITPYRGKKITISMTWISGTIQGATAEKRMHCQVTSRDNNNQVVKSEYPSAINSIGEMRQIATYDVDELIALGVKTLTINYWLVPLPIENLTYAIQVEIGETATAYEPPIVGKEMQLMVNGTSYTITPDSSPYTVPTDIMQVDGANIISIADDSNPTIAVNGSKQNSQMAKIYDMITKLQLAIIAEGGNINV